MFNINTLDTYREIIMVTDKNRRTTIPAINPSLASKPTKTHLQLELKSNM